MLDSIIRYVREQEPLAVISTIAAMIVAAVIAWQGDLSTETGWIGLAWAAATWLARRHVTPAARPVAEPGAQVVRPVRSPDAPPYRR